MREVGAAAMPIIPTFDGIKSDLERGLNGPMRDAGTKGGKGFGDNAGDSMRSSIGGHAKKAGLLAAGAVAAAGAAAGAGFIKYLGDAIERDAIEDRMAAALGATPRVAEQYGQVASNLYAGAWGESFDEVARGVEAVGSSFRRLRTADDLERVSAQAFDFATIFDADITDAVSKVSTVLKSGLAKNATEAFDLLTASSQRVPAALREDLLDAADEYGQFFDALGLSGSEAFGILVNGSRKGVYGLDKAGDAIKEFTVRSTDASAGTKEAFAAIGVDAEKMSNDILAGGKTANAAFKEILDGVLGIEDPTTRATTALALFGTPLEDLGVRDIPKFLRSLQDGSKGLKDWKGSIDDAGQTLNDNASTRLTGFRRSMEQNVVDFLGDKAVPVLEDDVLPALERFGEWFGDKGAPAIKSFIDDARPVAEEVLPAIGNSIEAIGGFLSDAAPLAKNFVGAFNDMPDWITDTAVLGALGLGVASKVKGGKGGAAGGLLGGGKGSSAVNPMYVWVVNGGAGPGGGGPGKGGKPGMVPLGGSSPFLALGGGYLLYDNAPDLKSGLFGDAKPASANDPKAIGKALKDSEFGKLFDSAQIASLSADLAALGTNAQSYKDAVEELKATNEGAWEDINDLIPVVGSWITTSGDRAAWALRDLQKVVEGIYTPRPGDDPNGDPWAGMLGRDVATAKALEKIPEAKLKVLQDPATIKTQEDARRLLGNVDSLTKRDFRLIFQALGLKKAREDAEALESTLRSLAGLADIPAGYNGPFRPSSSTPRRADRSGSGLKIDNVTINSLNANRLISDLQDIQRRYSIGGYS